MRKLRAFLARLLHPAARVGGGVEYVTKDQVKAQLEATAGLLGVSVDEAFARLDRGEFRGTDAELNLRMLRYLLNPEDELRSAA
jgi:hypothetical protein